MSKTEGLSDSLKEANNEIKKLSWKTSVGMEFSDSDKSDYENNVKQYVESAQNIIEQKGYEIRLGTSLLFDDSPEKTQLLKNNDYFYKELDGEVSELSGKINDKLQEGIKKGFTPDLQEEVDSLLNQMSEITDALTESQTDAKWSFLKTKWSGKDLDADSFKNLQKEVQANVKDLKDGAESAYKEGLANAGAKKKLGYIDDKEYQNEVQKYNEAYQNTIDTADERGQSFLYNSVMDAYGEKIANNTMSYDDKNAAKELFDEVAKINPTSTYGSNASVFGHAFDDDSRAVAGNFIEEFEVSWGLMDETTQEKLNKSAIRLAKQYLKDVKDELENGVNADIPIQTTTSSVPSLPEIIPGFNTGTSKATDKDTGKNKVKKHAKGGIFS